MNIIEYNYQKFTHKDMFEMKLKGKVPNFGYISCTKRNKFFLFCADIGFIEFIEMAVQKKRYAYRILIEFRYSAMGNYSASDVNCSPGEILVIDGAFRPQEKLHGVHTDKGYIRYTNDNWQSAYTSVDWKDA